MNYAVIDLGSNSMRLSVYDYTAGVIKRIFTEKEIVGLAGYVTDGVLDATGIEKACMVLNEFKESAARFVDAVEIRLFATASLRNINNRDEAVRIITDETALVPDVLEGDEEATLGFIGVSHFDECKSGVMIDIGGASTELVLFRDYKPAEIISLPIGCLNLSLDYVSEVIPEKKERKQIKAAINEQLDGITWGKNANCPLMVGTGGTLRAAAKISSTLFDVSATEEAIDMCYIKELKELLKNRNDSIYHAIYKSIPERLLTITTGVAILHQVAKKFGCEKITVSKYGIREGYLIDRVLGAGTEQKTDEEHK